MRHAIFLILGLLPLLMGTTYYAAPTAQGTGAGNTAENAMAIATAITTAVGGDTVLLTTGEYPNFAYNRNNTGWIDWQADDGATVVFVDGLRLGYPYSTANLYCRFSDVTIKTNVTSAPVRNQCVWTNGGSNTSTTTAGFLDFNDCDFSLDTDYATGVAIANIHDVTVRGCTIASASAVPADWLGKGVGVTQDSVNADIVQNIRVQDCTIHSVRYGISVTGVNVTITGNEIYDCTSDGILMTNGIDGGLIADNEIHDIYNVEGDAYPGDHCDFIQGQAGLAYEGTKSIPWRNITITRNIMYDSERQAILWNDMDVTVENVTITNNVSWGLTSWALELNNFENVIVRHNTFTEYSCKFVNCATLDIANNICHSFTFETGVTGLTATGNITTNWDETDAPAGNLEVSSAVFAALFTGFGGHDFTLAAGAVARDYGAIVDPHTDILGMERTDAAGVGNDGSDYADAGAYESIPASGPFPALATAPTPGDGGAGVALDAVLSWTAGADTTSHDVYFGTDSTPDATELVSDNQAGDTYDPGALAPNTTFYWRIDENNANGTTTGTVWSFTTTAGGAPAKAIYPGPADEAVGVTRYLCLFWSHGGAETPSFKLYFGTSEPGLALVATQEGLAYVLPVLAPATTYYWRVDTVAGETTTTGDVWTFTTRAVGKKAMIRNE